MYSLKAKSFEKWMKIYNYRKNKTAIEKVEYVQLKKDASLINRLRDIPNDK